MSLQGSNALQIIVDFCQYLQLNSKIHHATFTIAEYFIYLACYWDHLQFIAPIKFQLNIIHVQPI